MLNIGTGEILVILLMALLVLGPDKLPGAARTMGKTMREVRRLSSGLQHEMREAMKSADIDLDLPGITAPMAGAAGANGATGSNGSGLHPGLGRGPRLEAGAVVVDGTTSGLPGGETSPAVAGSQPGAHQDTTINGRDGGEGGNGASARGYPPVGSDGPVIRTDGPTGSFS
jgi:Tat protein translocase TatB subunit